MRNGRFISLVSTALLVFFAACSGSQEPIAGNEDPAPAEFKLKERENLKLSPNQFQLVSAQEKFAFESFNHILSNTEENFVFSPLSLSLLIGMTANGMDENPRKKVIEELVGGNCSLDELNTLNKLLVEELLKADNSANLGIFNAGWCDFGSPFKTQFSDNAKEFFDANISSLDFSKPSFPVEVNNWIKEKSNGLISSILEKEIPKQMLLANAMYFKGEWCIPFDKKNTESKPFHNIDNTMANTPMMHIDADKFYYSVSNKHQMVRLPFGNEAFALYIVMPTGEPDIEDIRNLLNQKDRKDFLRRYSFSSNVEVTLPRFEVNSHFTSLEEMTPSQELIKNFSDKESHSNLLQTALSENLLVNQKTVFKVDEEGAEGASVTFEIPQMADINSKPYIPVITFDHPFIFMLEEQSSGVILLMGAINKF